MKDIENAGSGPPAARIVLVGYGLAGKAHVSAIKQGAALELAAIVEPAEAGRRSAVSEGVPVFGSLEEMFDQVTSVDGVILATPTLMHVEQGLACIERQCPVLVEKPIAATSADGLMLVKAANNAKVPLLVGHHRRYNPIVRTAKSAIENGEIGQLRAVQTTCWFYKPDHYFDEAPWRTKKGAGPISVNLVHDVDLLRHFCGEVVRVQAQAVPSIRRFENEDLAAAILTFSNGAIATISVADAIASPWSWELTARENPDFPPTDQSCYLIGGTLGALSVPDLKIWSHEGSPNWWTPMAARNLSANSGESLTDQALHFANVIRGNETPIVSGVEGLKSLQVVEAIQQAADTGQAVEIEQLDIDGEVAG
ncbi:MAG: Gfo/Idh/MocA family oxidoreductase [Pseudomonadota bacterium]